MKKILILLIGFHVLPLLANNQPSGPVKLESDIIDFIDGKPFGINHEVIGFMLQIRREILAVVKSKVQKTKKDLELLSTKEIHDYLSRTSQTLSELIQLSKVLENRNHNKQEQKRYEQLKDTFSINELSVVASYLEQAKEALKEEYQHLKALLEEVLHKAREYFSAIVEPFMEHARGAKDQMMLLIKESCKKRKRMDSLLMRWGMAKEGDEEQQFHKDVTNFKVFDTFCHDLINFLQDLIASCPKAQKQFKDWLREQKNKNTR